MLFFSCKDSFLSESDLRNNLDLTEKGSDEPLDILKSEDFGNSLEKITYLEKAAEIGDRFSIEDDNFFAEISDITIDDSDNLYVADSKMHRIFKFNSKHELILAFGRQGQGPGEFTGELMISVGNDGKIYISDHGNFRLLIFTSEGILLKQFPLPRNTYDKVVADSKGEMYLFSENGFFIMDHFDASFNYIQSFLDLKYLLEFPIESPPERIFRQLMKMSPTSSFVFKFISHKDELCVVLNNSHAVICMDEKRETKTQFKVEHPRFIDDLTNRLKVAKKKKKWINAIRSAFIDNRGNISLCYYNLKINTPEIYRYRRNGEFVDTMRFEGHNTSSKCIITTCDSGGNFYGIDHENHKISIYKIKEGPKI